MFDEKRYRQLKQQYPAVRGDEVILTEDEEAYQRDFTKRLRAQRNRWFGKGPNVNAAVFIAWLLGIALFALGALLLYRIVLFALTGHFTPLSRGAKGNPLARPLPTPL